MSLGSAGVRVFTRVCVCMCMFVSQKATGKRSSSQERYANSASRFANPLKYSEFCYSQLETVMLRLELLNVAVNHQHLQ